MEERAIFKMNGGWGALLCSSCHTIIKVGKDLTLEEMRLLDKGELPAQYCVRCKALQQAYEGNNSSE